MPSQSKQKPAFLVRSLNWRGTSSPSLPKAEVKQAKCTALRVPKIRASANVKVTTSAASIAITSSVLKPLMLVEKLLKGEVVVPLPRSAKRNGLRPLALIEKLKRDEPVVEVSHPPPVGTEVVAAKATEATVVEPPAEVVSPVARETINQAPQLPKKVTGSPKLLDIAAPLGSTKNIKVTIGAVKVTQTASVIPGKKSPAIPVKFKAGMGVKPKSGPRAIKDLDSISKSKNLQVSNPSFSATSTSPKPVRSSTKLAASIVVPRVSVPKPTGSGSSIQARKQPLKPSTAVAHATSAPANGGKISLQAPISRSKSVNKPLAAVRPKVPTPSSRAKTIIISSFASSKPTQPASSNSPTKAIIREPEDGKAPTGSQIEINPKSATPSVQDPPVQDISIAEVVPVIPQQSEELQQQETQQRALASILGDISNMPKLRARGASGGPSTPKASPRTEPETRGTDFIDELKDRLAARSKLYGSITSFPKVSNTPESSQKDFRSVLRSASVSKKVPEAKVEEVSDLQRVFQRRGKKMAALASRI